MKKNVLKTTTVVAIIASSIMVFAPITYGKTISVEQSVTNVKNELNKAASQYVFPALEGKLSPSDTLYPTLNSTKKNYESTRAAITTSSLSAEEIEGKLKEIDAVYDEKISKGLVSYIDAYNYATKYLEPLMKQISDAEAKNDFVGVAAGYHKLSYQLSDRSSILYRFSGKAARDLLLEQYKKPADSKRDELKLPVTIYMKLIDLNNLYTAGKKEDALKAYTELNILMNELPKTSRYSSALLSEVAKIKAIIEDKPVTSNEQQALDKKVAGLVATVNINQKNVLLSSTSSNSLTVTIKEDVSIVDFISQGFYTTLISSLGVTKVNGNDPMSDTAMNELKSLFSSEAKTLNDLKGKSFNLPLTVNNGSEVEVAFTLAFN